MKIATYIITAAAGLLLAASCGSSRRTATSAVPPKAVRPVVPPLSHNDSLRYKLYFFEAMNQQTAGNFDAAYSLYAHCRDINPNAPEAWFMLSNYDALLGGDSLALADLKKATDLAPDNSDYLERLAGAYLKTNNEPEAIKAYERLYANSPQRDDVLAILTQLYERAKNYDGMLRTIERTEALEGMSEQTALAKMHVYALKGEKDKERAVLDELCEKHPGDMNFRVMTGNWLLQNGEPQEALKAYRSALEVDPQNQAAQMSMIDYYRATGDTLKADSVQTAMLVSPATPVDTKMTMMQQVVANNEKNGADSSKVLSLFRKIMAVKQKTTDMAELYAAYMNLKKMPQDSIDNVLKFILKQAPDNTAARLELIKSEWNRQNFNRVEELSRQALEYNADMMPFYYFLGMALVQQERDKDALAAFRKATALESAKDNTPLLSDCYGIMGDILHDMGKAREAYAAYDSCLQYKDDNFGCLNNYAYYLSEEGHRLNDAARMSYKTVQAEPDNATYLDTYAWILFKLKRYSEAAQYIDMAIKNDTTGSAVLLEHAGDIHAMKGDTATALKFWRKALQVSDGNNKALIRKIKLKKYVNEK